MSADPNSFIFELEESLFFEKGQEVEELRGISIEPEITIHTLDNYISIRGSIELEGEYQKVPSAEEEEEVLDFDQIQAKRFVESIREVNGLYVFSHRFPIDISVPPHRVRNTEDVTVQIESFDYDLLEADCLKISAAVEIHGILQEEEYRPNEQEEQEEKQEEEDEEEREAVEEVGDIFTFELKHPEESLVREDNSNQAEDDPDRWKVKSQPLSEYFQSLADNTDEEEEEEMEEEENEETEYPDEVEMPDEEELFIVDDDEPVLNEMEMVNQPNEVIYTEPPRDEGKEIITEEEETEQVPLSEKDEDISGLSDLFREAEEEEFVRMRLCIVQENDTIETIAERFSISPLQLIKHNQLESDFEVSQGQLLYIPAK